MLLIWIAFKNERTGNTVQELLVDRWASKTGEAKLVCIYVIHFSRKEIYYSEITKIEMIVLWGPFAVKFMMVMIENENNGSVFPAFNF